MTEISSAVIISVQLSSGRPQENGNTRATSGTYDATLTGCNHLTGTQAGADHTNVSDGPWTTMHSADLPPGTFAVGADPKDEYLVALGTGVAFPVTPATTRSALDPGSSRSPRWC